MKSAQSRRPSAAATAIEERNALERAERDRYRTPWSMISTREKSSRVYKFTLGGDESVSDVRITVDDEYTEREKFRLVKPQSELMRPGESMTLSLVAAHGLGSSDHR